MFASDSRLGRDHSSQERPKQCQGFLGRFRPLLRPVILTAVVLLSSCSKPAPLNTSFRRSALDSAGLVLQVRNTSGKSLSCAMTAKNKTDGQTCRYSFSLAPSGSTEIGIMEAGWSFKSGERVQIDVEGHRGISLQVP